jgi:hypothetical protein
MADQRATDRAHQVADREHPERRKQLGDRIFLPEEVLALCTDLITFARFYKNTEKQQLFVVFICISLFHFAQMC